MALTLTELVGEVQRGLLNRTDLTDARCVLALNLAQEALDNEKPWKELQVLNINTLSVSADEFTDKFVNIDYYIKKLHVATLKMGSQAWQMEVRTLPWMQNRFPDPENRGRGRPVIIAPWGMTTLLLNRIPDQAYQLHLYITTRPRPFNLTLGPTATSDLVNKDILLIDHACGYLWKSFGRPDKGNDMITEVLMRARRIWADDQDTPATAYHPNSYGNGGGDYWSDPFVRSMPE